MGRLNSLFRNMPPWFNPDPQGLSAISLNNTNGAVFTVANLTLSAKPTSGSALNISLQTITLSTLATTVAATSGYSATVLGGLGAIKAYALVEGAYTAVGGSAVTVPYFTSPNYQVFAPLGAMYDVLESDWNEALKQVDLRRASGIWLDRIGLVYGVTRTASEPDSRYARRISSASIAQKCNGYGIAAIVKNALGATATVTDTGPAAFSTTVVINLSTGNPYDSGTLNTLVNSYKAFGTTNTTVIQGTSAETDAAATNVDSLISSVVGGSGQFGRPEFGTRESGA